MEAIHNMRDLGIYQKHLYGNGKGFRVEVRESKMRTEYFGIVVMMSDRGQGEILFPIENVRTVDGAFEVFEEQAKAFIAKKSKEVEDKMATEEAAKKKVAEEYAAATKKFPEVKR